MSVGIGALQATRAGSADATHFAYPTYARAARTRRENLTRSTDELRDQLGEAKRQLGEAVAELDKAQSLDGREKGVERPEFPSPASLIDGMLGLQVVQA